MSGVSGVGGGPVPQPPVNTSAVGGGQAAGGAAAGSGSSVGGTASGSPSVSSFSSSLSQRVSTFMSTVGSTLTDQQLLRALVMMLLLEMMEKEQDGPSRTGALLLAGTLGATMGTGGSSSFISMSSSTSMHQAGQQSVALDTSHALQSLSNGGGPGGQGQGPSQQLDVRA